LPTYLPGYRDDDTGKRSVQLTAKQHRNFHGQSCGRQGPFGSRAGGVCAWHDHSRLSRRAHGRGVCAYVGSWRSAIRITGADPDRRAKRTRRAARLRISARVAARRCLEPRQLAAQGAYFTALFSDAPAATVSITSRSRIAEWPTYRRTAGAVKDSRVVCQRSKKKMLTPATVPSNVVQDRTRGDVNASAVAFLSVQAGHDRAPLLMRSRGFA